VEDAEKLAQQIRTLTTVLENSKKEGALSPEVVNRMERLSSLAALLHLVNSTHLFFYSSWKQPSDEVQNISSRFFVNRALRYQDDAEAISGHIQAITWSIHSFTVRRCFFMTP